jgi:hypothetical protein
MCYISNLNLNILILSRTLQPSRWVWATTHPVANGFTLPTKLHPSSSSFFFPSQVLSTRGRQCRSLKSPARSSSNPRHSKYKSWRTTILLPWASLLMITGFAVRLAGAYNTGSIVYLIVSTVLIMSGPPVYALINYCESPSHPSNHP